MHMPMRCSPGTHADWEGEGRGKGAAVAVAEEEEDMGVDSGPPRRPEADAT